MGRVEIPQRSSLRGAEVCYPFDLEAREAQAVRRREFITLLGGAAAAWPLAARAQQPDRMRQLGVLMGFPESDLQAQTYLAAFKDRLQKLGWMEGRNIRIETRWATHADLNSMQGFAKELV